jgi:hypothetical protein
MISGGLLPERNTRCPLLHTTLAPRRFDRGAKTIDAVQRKGVGCFYLFSNFLIISLNKSLCSRFKEIMVFAHV